MAPIVRKSITIGVCVLVGIVAIWYLIFLGAKGVKQTSYKDELLAKIARLERDLEVKELQRQLDDCRGNKKELPPVVKYVPKKRHILAPKKETPPAPKPEPAKAAPQQAPAQPQVIVVRVEANATSTQKEEDREPREERRTVVRRYDYYEDRPRRVVEPHFYYRPGYYRMHGCYPPTRNYGGYWEQQPSGGYPNHGPTPSGGPNHGPTPGPGGGPNHGPTPGPGGGPYHGPTGGPQGGPTGGPQHGPVSRGFTSSGGFRSGGRR